MQNPSQGQAARHLGAGKKRSAACSPAAVPASGTTPLSSHMTRGRAGPPGRAEMPSGTVNTFTLAVLVGPNHSDTDTQSDPVVITLKKLNAKS